MNVLICGIDGYLGWSLALYLTARGHKVSGLDSEARRFWVSQAGSDSGIPIPHRSVRQGWVIERGGYWGHFNLKDHRQLCPFIDEIQPDAIVHLAEMPSAPWSMQSFEHCRKTHDNNVLGTLSLLWALKARPSVHLVKLGTMGEYGTLGVPIPEGSFVLDGHSLPFPKSPGSFYHCTKVHDTTNIELANRVWRLTCTDVMQGVVYGTSLPEMTSPELATRFDFDEQFGTALNRFCAQAVLEMPLTPYGKGGQRRGFLPLEDSMQCLELLIRKPPQPGELRVVNQLDRVYNVTDLARTVAEQARSVLGTQPEIKHWPNPRVELEEHSYEVCTDALTLLGYRPKADLEGTVRQMLQDLQPHRKRLEQFKGAVLPKTTWR